MIVLVLQIRKVEVAIRTSHFMCVGARSTSGLSGSKVKSFILIKKSRFPERALSLLGCYASYNSVFLRKRWVQLCCINPGDKHVLHSNHLVKLPCCLVHRNTVSN